MENIVKTMVPTRHIYCSLFGGFVLSLMLLATSPLVAQEKYTLDTQGWQKQTRNAPNSPEAKLQAVRKAIAEQRFAQAQKQADQWLKEYPNHPLVPKAYLARGDAKYGQRHYYKSLFDYELLIRQYPSSENYELALEREFELAQLFAHGVKRRWIGIRWIPATGEAEEIFIRTQERAPGSDIGERASLALADYYFNNTQMASASEAYDIFLLNYPDSLHREKVMLRLIQANLASFKGPVYDSTGLLNAEARIRQYRKEFPAASEQIGGDALLERINESHALKLFETAKWYQGQHKQVSAVYIYRRLVHDFQGTSAGIKAARMLDKLGKDITDKPNTPQTSQAPAANQAKSESPSS